MMATSSDLRHLDPLAVLLRAGDGGLDERHAGHAVDDPGVLEGLRDLLAELGPDGQLEAQVEVGQGLVEAFGVAGRDADVRLDRGGEIAVFGPEAVELDRLAAFEVLEDVVVGDRPFERPLGPADAEAVVVLGADGDLRGGDGGDPAVLQLGQDGEIVVEGPPLDERS